MQITLENLIKFNSLHAKSRSVLLDILKLYGNTTPPMYDADLATYLNTDKCTLSKALKQLRELNIIEKTGFKQYRINEDFIKQ